jgi:hypothetical protein
MQIKYACLLEGPQGDRMLLKVQNGEKVNRTLNPNKIGVELSLAKF